MRTTKPLLHRLGQRYGVVIEDPVNDNVTKIEPKLVLTSDADELLKQTKVYKVTLDISGGGTNTAHTVPPGKRWEVFYTYQEGTANAARLDLNYITASIIISTTGTAGQLIWDHYWMEENWHLDIVGGGAGDTAIDVAVLVREEDTF